MGAEDYVTEPARPRSAPARIAEDREFALLSRIQVLEEALGYNEGMPLCLDLTPILARILAVLLHRDAVTTTGLYGLLYEGRSDGELPEPQVVEVHLCRLGKKLARFGVRVERVGWGTGVYRLDADNKAIVRKLYDLDPAPRAAWRAARL